MLLQQGLLCGLFSFFFFNDTATTEIYTLSLHDALPISLANGCFDLLHVGHIRYFRAAKALDRKSTRLNSSHLGISYAVFCLKKKISAVLTTDKRRRRIHPRRLESDTRIAAHSVTVPPSD